MIYCYDLLLCFLKIDLLINSFFNVVQKMFQLQFLWGVFITTLLMLSAIVPGAFLGVLVVFYVPIIIGLLYIIWELFGPYSGLIILLCFYPALN